MPPVKIPGTMGLEVKPNGRIATLETKVEALEASLDVVIWLHAELMYKVKMLVTQAILANPEIQERLKNSIASQLSDKLM